MNLQPKNLTKENKFPINNCIIMIDKIEELKNLKSLLDQGEISTDKFHLLKEQIISIQIDSNISEYSINRDVLPKYKKNKVKNKNLFFQSISISSILVLLFFGGRQILGGDDYFFASMVIIGSLILYISLFKLITLLLPKLTTSLIMIILPVTVGAFIFFDIDLFSKYTYDFSIKKIETFQYNHSPKKIPYEIYYVNINPITINGKVYENLRNGVSKEFNKKGELILKSIYNNGILVGEAESKDTLSKMYVHFMNDLTPEKIKMHEDSIYKRQQFLESNSNDISLLGTPIARNGKLLFMEYYFAEGVIGGITEGDFSIYFKKSIFVEGKSKSGFLEGDCKFYTPEGKIYKKVSYTKGYPIETIVYKDNIITEACEIIEGNTKIISSKLFNGNFHGAYKKLDKYGEIVEEGNYIDGNKDGSFKVYKRDCSIRALGCVYQIEKIEGFKNGYLDGGLTYYHSGMLFYNPTYLYAYSQEYTLGKKDGKFAKYALRPTSNGTIEYTEEYKEGSLVSNSHIDY